MTYRKPAAYRYEAGVETRTFKGTAVQNPGVLRRLTVNLPRTIEFCCENSGEWREENSAKPLNSW